MRSWTLRWARGVGIVTALSLAIVTPAVAAGSAELPSVAPSSYAVDYVANQAAPVDMNDAGDVLGTSGSDAVVWRGGQAIVLPSLPGLSPVFATDINNQGWVTGSVGVPGLVTRAVVWKPNGNSYTAVDLGVLPGTTVSTAAGIDDLGRVVGWSTVQTFPPVGAAPFVWSEAGGMANLAAQGFPAESPLGISPGGTVATFGHWYRLGDPASVTAMAAPPQGFLLESSKVAINDAGDQARFLLTTTSEILDYPFRYHHGGTWQQLSSAPTGHLTRYGVGSINAAQDITMIVQSTAMVAFGPDGLAQTIGGLVSPAYAGSAVTSVGAMNASGQIAAQMIIGQSGRRLVRLVPAEPCTTSCIRVSNIQMKGTGPAFCDQGEAQASAKLTVTSETGAKLSGVTVTAHFFDDYFLDTTVVGTTNSRGVVRFTHVGPPCVGAIAILVTSAMAPGRTLDRTTGLLTKYVIPLP